MVGLYLTTTKPQQPDNDELVKKIIEANIELLAEAEHDGWMNSRLRNGWRYGKLRDTERRIHHLLIPFRKLDDGERQKDYNAVRNYTEIVASNKTPYYIVTERPEA